MDKKQFFESLIGVTKVVAPAIATERVYNKMFGHHFSTFLPLYFSDQDFPKLEKERHVFKSINKKKLVGYIYKQKGKQIKGIFVFCHGYGGGGHHCYLDLINCICKQGYLVFAYDASSCDESEGNNIKGFTQGMLDADQALSYVESLKKYSKLPLYLMGHSWGAYSASTALGWHKRVKGLIAMSGFNSATTIFKANGERYAGEQANDFMVYVDTYEKLLFGNICQRTAIESFKESKAKIVIVHSEDDSTVPIEAGFKLYKKAFRGDKRFKFVKFKDQGHGTIYYTKEGKAYFDKINSEYERFVKKQKPEEEARLVYLKEHIDRKIYNNLVDEKLIKKLISYITK